MVVAFGYILKFAGNLQELSAVLPVELHLSLFRSVG